MAEYLSPGVYVEEIDTGPRPIEGVSTSTAGMVGMAERGPIDRPILITSAGEYQRWFGGLLPRDEFADPADPNRSHCYLPYAVEGFFTNGGKRVYVTRVLPDEAIAAQRQLYDRGTVAGDAGTVLLRRAGIGEGIGIPLYLLDTTGVAAGDSVRIGDGSRAEYLQVAAAPVAATSHVPLNRPLTRSHDTTVNMLTIQAPAAIGVGPFSLDSAAAAGTTVLVVDSPLNLAAQGLPFLLQLSDSGTTDVVAVVTAPAALGGTLFRVEINEALSQAYATGATVDLFTSAAGANFLVVPASPGDTIVFADANIPFAANFVELDQGTPNHEVRLMGELRTATLDQPLPVAAPAGSAFVHVTLADDGAITAKALTAAAPPGTRVLALNNRVDVAVGQVVRISVGLDEEFSVILAIPGERGATPDAGTITLATGVTGDHASGVVVQVQDPPAFPAGGHQSSFTLLDAAAGGTDLLLVAGQNYAAADGVMVRRPDGTVSYHRVSATAVPPNTGEVTLAATLTRVHAVGEVVLERRALIDVVALDAGAWGNRLRLSVQDDTNGLLAHAQTVSLTPPLQMRLTTLTGVEPGTLVEVTNPGTGASVLLTVRMTDPTTSGVTLDPPGLDAAALATLGPIGGALAVRSREFSLTVRLYRRPDPAVPSRNTQVIASETIGQLSMDHRHARYFPEIIGDINGPPRLEDGRREGESLFIRVSDRAANLAATEAIRLGPEALVDVLPSGRIEPARHPLAGGDDSIATMNDAIYLGVDDPEPLNRTGLQSLRNIQQVSIVAVPGQASVTLQGGLISHCELMRYRFAVLDAVTADASLADVQAQRLAFDSKYAALYYPWFTIPDPMPDNLAAVRDFHLPPSGHVLGIYARTDETRGVHKAPANEVVRGIARLSRHLTKGEHDILNPMNICVTRDFRPDGRSIRVWGARCITSDSTHKYVPVRRLLIYLEQSIEIGLQYVVFEPNAPALWRRVRQTISNFLTDVWRDGALEGTKVEEAFFVKCDRTTMTQSDIDNGRLICVVGVAPVKPAEFVIIRLGFFTATAEE